MFNADKIHFKKTYSPSAPSLELTVLPHGARDLEPSFVSGENVQVFERALAAEICDEKKTNPKFRDLDPRD